MLKSLILSAVVGVFICTMSLIMFDLAMHSLRAKVSKVHAVVKRVSSKMSETAPMVTVHLQLKWELELFKCGMLP